MYIHAGHIFLDHLSRNWASCSFSGSESGCFHHLHIASDDGLSGYGVIPVITPLTSPTGVGDNSPSSLDSSLRPATTLSL